MPTKVHHVDDDSENRVNWMVGLEMEIPTRKKFNIETGLRYKNEMLCSDYSDDDAGHMVNHIEIPIRLAYKYRMRENLALRAGIGPYLGLGISGDDFSPKIGIDPSVAVDWKCLSFGLTYNHPFYLAEGGKYKANSGLMLTLGIRFGSNKWKYVGAGLAVAGAVAGTVSAAISSNTNTSGTNGYVSSGAVGNSSSEGGRGTHTCAYCHGNGICRFCNGSGQGPKTIMGTNVHENCHYCHGKKICHKCNGKGVVGNGSSSTSGKTSNSVSGSCKDCHGSGICGECDGKGITYVAGTPSECRKCHGSRKCTSCKGGTR